MPDNTSEKTPEQDASKNPVTQEDLNKFRSIYDSKIAELTKSNETLKSENAKLKSASGESSLVEDDLALDEARKTLEAQKEAIATQEKEFFTKMLEWERTRLIKEYNITDEDHIKKLSEMTDLKDIEIYVLKNKGDEPTEEDSKKAPRVTTSPPPAARSSDRLRSSLTELYSKMKQNVGVTLE